MAVVVIDTIKPKNQGTFPVVEAKDVKVDNNDKRLDTALGEKASQADVTALSETVSGKANQSDLTALSNTVSGKASQADLTALSNTVADKADKSALAETNAAVAGKQAALTEAQLAACNSGITAQLVTQIGTNTTAIAGKADATDLTALESEVDNKANASDVATATSNLQSQIDLIVTPVTQDAEVQNARVDEGGTSHSSLKSRLDSEFAETKSSCDALQGYLEDMNMLEISTVSLTARYTEVDKYATKNANNKVLESTLSGCSCYIFDVSQLAGKKLLLSTTLISTTYPMFYLIASDTDNACLDYRSDATETVYSNYKITIPQGAKWLYLNFKNGETASATQITDSVFDIEPLNTEVVSARSNYNTLDDRISAVENAAVVTSTETMEATYTETDKYGTKNASDVVREENMNGNTCYIYDVSGLIGEKILITTTLISSSFPMFYLFAAADGNTSLEDVSDPTTLEYTNYEVIVPQGAKWLYVNADSSETESCTHLAQTTLIDAFEEIELLGINSTIYGKSCVCFGDSITWYDGHAYNWGKEEGVIAKGYESYLREAGMTVENKGYSGARIDQILDEKIKTTNFTNYDYVTVTSGANDSRYNFPTGEIAPIGSTFNTNTFIGCLQEAVEYILTSNPEIKILLLTPIRGWIYAPDGYAYTPKPETDGVVEARYAEAIKAVAEFYGLPVCDWYSDCQVNLLTRPWFMNDPEPDKTAATNPNDLYSLHPSTKGYKRMSELLLSKIRSI